MGLNSEEALNGIYDILQATIDLYNQQRAQASKPRETSGIFEELLSGVAAAAYKDVDLGQQINALADGMSMLKNEGIEVQDALNIAKMIETIGSAVCNLKFDDKGIDNMRSLAVALRLLGQVTPEQSDNIAYLSDHLDPKKAAALVGFLDTFVMTDPESVKSVVEAISMFSHLDTEVIDKIDRLGDLDVNVAKTLSQFVRSLDLGSIEALKDDNLKNSLKTFTEFLKNITAVLDTQKLSFKSLFMPLKARLIARSIGEFFKEIVKALPEDEINVSMQGVGELFRALHPLLDENGKMSIKRMRAVINKESGQTIAEFFTEIIKVLPAEDLKFGQGIDQVRQLLELITTFGSKEYKKIKKYLTTDNGKQIGNFFAEIIRPLQGLDKFDFKPVTNFLNTLAGIGIIGSLGLMMLKPILTPEFGENIAGFVTKLTTGIKASDLDRLKEFSTGMKHLAQGVFILVSAIGLLAAEIMFFGPMTIVSSMVLTTMFVAGIMGIMKVLSKGRRQISTGLGALKDIAKVLTIMTIDVTLLTVAATMADQINWGSAWMIVETMILSGIFMTVAMYVSNKWRRGGDAALKTMIGLSALMLASVGSVALAAQVAREYSWDELALGIGMIAAVAVGGYFVVEYLLKKSNRDFEKALTNMFALIGIMAATSLVLMTLVAPLSNHWEKILGGIGIVAVSISSLSLIVGVLANKTKSKSLEQATISIAAMAGIMMTVSLIDLLILPKLVENTAQILGGLAIVAAEIVGLALVVGVLAKVKKQNLEDATNTMIGTAKILGIVSVASMLLIPIGMMWDSVALGFITVLGIGAALIGLTYLLTKVKNQDLEDAQNAMLRMGLIVGAVAVSSLLFVPIGMLADKILPGALLVMGVVGAMTGMAWLLSKIDEDSLDAASRAMLVIGGMVLGVSIIALTLFIPIAHQVEDVAVGAAVVLGIVGAMTLITWGLSMIKEDNLRMSTIAMGTMALIILGVSLITTELIIPIGYEKEDAWNGLAVIGTIIGGMLASVIVLSLIKKESLLWGLLAMAGMGVIVMGVAWLVDNFIIPLGDKWEQAAKGGAVIAGTLVGMGVLVTLASLIPKSKVIAGGATVAALGGLLWLISKTMEPYIELCMTMQKNAGEIAIGGLEIAATLTAWGTLMGVIGAVLISAPMVALAVAAGGATLAGISAILGVIGKMMPLYINTCKLVYQNKEMADRGPVMLTMLLGEIGALMAAIGVTLGNPISALAIAAGAGYIKQLNGIMRQLHGTVASLVSIMKMISANHIDLAHVREFNELFLGDDGIANSIKNITSRMADTGLWTSMKARVIANNIRPLFSVLSMFVDVVSKTLNGRFVEEWGPDGKPSKYRSFNASDFSAAAISISKSFRIFLDQMNEGLKDIKPKSIAIMNLLGIGIRPLIGAVSSFTKSILSVLSKAIPEAFDPNTGKPTSYKKFDPTEFGVAAITISFAFSVFLMNLRPGIQALGKPAAEIISMMGKGILPLVESIAKFTDMVLGFVNGKVYEYLKDGKTVKELVKVDPTKFIQAGKNIADAFTGFIDAIYQAFSKNDYLSVEEHIFSSDEVVVGGKIGQLIESLKNVGTLVDQTQKFIDMIIKTTKQTEGIDVATKGLALAKALTSFTDNMIAAYKDEQKRTDIADTIKTVKLIKSLISWTSSTYSDLIKLLDKQHKIEELADLGKNGVDVSTGTLLLIENIKMLQGIDMPDVRKIAGLPGYVKYAVKTAKELKELSDVMLDKNITDSILKFLKDINLLTEPDLRDRSETSRRALIMFGNDLVKFTTDVKKTQVQIVKFQHQMDKATHSLRKFDDALINNERKRQESLEKFAKAIKEITDNMAELHSQFESLNENKLLGTFGNIMRLINTVSASRNVSSENASGNNAQSNIGGTANQTVVRQAPMNAPAQNTTNNFVANGGVPQQMLVTMVFSNTQFTGTMEVKSI